MSICNSIYYIICVCEYRKVFMLPQLVHLKTQVNLLQSYPSCFQGSVGAFFIFPSGAFVPAVTLSCAFAGGTFPPGLHHRGVRGPGHVCRHVPAAVHGVPVPQVPHLVWSHDLDLLPHRGICVPF